MGRLKCIRGEWDEREGERALTWSQGSPGRSTPEAGSQTESLCKDTLWCGRTVQNREQNNRSIIKNIYQ